MTKSRILWLSVGAALATILLKFGAYLLTGSVSLLSDAVESLVNLAAAVFALIALQIASQPADEDHQFGHDKAEYFSSGVEGFLILVAALGILYSAVDRLLHPTPIEQLGWGLAISLIASGINFGVAQVLFGAARSYDSITLEADAHHLMTDVWTSVGVLAGLGVAMMTDWWTLDSVIAVLVAFNILRAGSNLVIRSARGLMDYTLPSEEIALIERVLTRHQEHFVSYHALRTRKSGPRRFIDLHLLVTGDMSVNESHALCEQIEREVKKALDQTIVTIHVEPAEDKVAWDGDWHGGLAAEDGPGNATNVC